MEKKWFDITVPVTNGMLHWPGDPDVEIKQIAEFSKDGVNISGISFGLHTGTHMDAPLHFIDKGDDISSVPPEILIGKTKVIDIENPEFIGRKELEGKGLNNYERVLFRTRNSDEEWFRQDFKKDYVFLDEGGAEYLVSIGVKVIGIDYLSIGQFKNGRETHRILLRSGIWIIEGLYLKDVPEGEYTMYALPLKIEGADGSPVRVVLTL
jgi:arylformamidase